MVMSTVGKEFRIGFRVEEVPLKRLISLHKMCPDDWGT